MVMAGAELIPLEPYERALKPWLMKCGKCGKEFRKTYNSVQQGTACRFCANRGLDLRAPALIYLIFHEGSDAYKIGVMGLSTDRPKRHGSRGWVLINWLSVATGAVAYEIEQRALAALRIDLRLPPALDSIQMPQAGWSETVSADDIDALTIWKIITDSTNVLSATWTIPQ